MNPFDNIKEPKPVIGNRPHPIEPKDETEDEFLLHLVDVVACFAMEQNMYYATSTRKELIQKARETFKPAKP